MNVFCNKIITRFIYGVMCCAFLSSYALANELQIETQDHLSLMFNQNGSFRSLVTNKENILTKNTASGFWVRDVKANKVAPFEGEIESKKRAIIFSGKVEPLQLKIHAEFVGRKNHIRIKGNLEELSAGERAVDLELRLYCDAIGAKWDRDIQVSKTITQNSSQINTFYPFHGLTLPNNRGAIGIGIAAEEPAVFEFSYKNNEYYVLKLKYGLSTYSTGRLYKKAQFNILIFKIDPNWGFRSVVKIYYDIHKRWFERRAKKNGLWLWRNNADEVPNPWDYAYREGGPEGWENDERWNIATCPYTIIGQREIKRLPNLPEDYKDQIAVLKTLETNVFKGWRVPQSNFPAAGLREIILNSGLHDQVGHYRIVPRQTSWGGNSLTFPVNPSPLLYENRPLATVGKIGLEWVEWVLNNNCFLDGVYIDSLSSWGAYYNHRRDHFPYASISLTYDPETDLPAIHNSFAHLEYLYSLRERLHKDNKILFGNGIRPANSTFFAGMLLDVLGSENNLNSLVNKQFMRLLYKRIVAYKKPFLIINNNEKDWSDINKVANLWEIGLFFGIYPGYNWKYQKDEALYKRHKHIIKRFIPLLKQLDTAGWEPLTFAMTDKDEIWIERYGDISSGLYFTVFNTSNEKQKFSIELQKAILRLADRFSCVDLLNSDGDGLRVDNNKLHYELAGKKAGMIKIVQ